MWRPTAHTYLNPWQLSYSVRALQNVGQGSVSGVTFGTVREAGTVSRREHGHQYREADGR
jgi:hypothetical protein